MFDNLIFVFIVVLELTVTTNKENPSISAHEITLGLPNMDPLSFKVPWPILAQGIEFTVPNSEEAKEQEENVHPTDVEEEPQ